MPYKFQFTFDPRDPEKSFRKHLKKGQHILKYFQEDDGKYIAFTYRDKRPGTKIKLAQNRSYAMIRPKKDAAQQLLQTDIIVKERDMEGNPELLKKFKRMGFEITGYIDNRFTDMIGLVNEQPETAPYQLLEYVTLQEAEEKAQAWRTADHPSLEEAKQPFYDYWNAYIYTVEELLQRDWTEVKRNATQQRRFVRQFIRKTKDQKPDQN